MENTPKKITGIPFTGFYESDHDYMIDSALESIFETDRDCGGSPAVPDEVYCGNPGVDFSAIQNDYSKEYVEAFESEFESITGIKLGLEFESMTSPREYNFTTDKIWAYIPDSTIEALFAESAKEDHVILKSEIKARFTSRPGFSSFYHNELGNGPDYKTLWPDDPLEWDHNQLETLIRVVLIQHGEDFDDSENFRAWNLFDYSDSVYGIVESHVPQVFFNFADFQAEQGRALSFEAWQESPAYAVYKAECDEGGVKPLEFEAWQALNPESESYRCAETPDLF